MPVFNRAAAEKKYLDEIRRLDIRTTPQIIARLAAAVDELRGRPGQWFDDLEPVSWWAGFVEGFRRGSGN